MRREYTITHDLATPGTGKDCSDCGKHLTLGSYYRTGHKLIMHRCRVCYKAQQNCDYKKQAVVYGPPLMVAHYEYRIINGERRRVYAPKVSGS